MVVMLYVSLKDAYVLFTCILQGCFSGSGQSYDSPDVGEIVMKDVEQSTRKNTTKPGISLWMRRANERRR